MNAQEKAKEIVDKCDELWLNNATHAETGQVACAKCIAAALTEAAQPSATVRELVEAAIDAVGLLRQPGESHNDAFERVAELFYRETGILAPGKDQPAAANNFPTGSEREERWRDWQVSKLIRFNVALAVGNKEFDL